jgi:hypothetical protein
VVERGLVLAVPGFVGRQSEIFEINGLAERGKELRQAAQIPLEGILTQELSLDQRVASLNQGIPGVVGGIVCVREFIKERLSRKLKLCEQCAPSDFIVQDHSLLGLEHSDVPPMLFEQQ